ncbi:MAG: haloacid dehalogenase type II [Candidatus Sedimenticola sp. (ex Thyasira tokunagai)]
MALTLAFDVYGTLIDTHGITEMLEEFIGDQAAHFSSRWREKQLEYSFRRGLMSCYADFSVCTRDALNHTSNTLEHPLSDTEKEMLLNSYRYLPAFSDAIDALKALKADGHRLFAFSNGLPSDLNTLLENAAIDSYFQDIISVHEVKSFKPDPSVYHHFLERSGATASHSWLISSNPFDVIGALSCDMKAAWVQRSSDHHFDPWGIKPTTRVSSLQALYSALKEFAV